MNSIQNHIVFDSVTLKVLISCFQKILREISYTSIKSKLPNFREDHGPKTREYI